MQYKTILKARIPRVINTDGKVSTLEVPWADFSDHYTHLFAMAVIQLLQFNKNQTNTAKFFKISFDVVNRIMRKAVERGLARRDKTVVIESIGIDEKAFQQGHHYCTIITDATNKCVLEVVDGRTIESAKTAINAALSHQQQQTLQTVTGDMWEGFQTEPLKKLYLMPTMF